MATDITQPARGRYPATTSPEVDFALVLSRVIDSAKENPAELRHAIYEIARIKLRQEGWNSTPPVDGFEMQRLTVALETAIERVEAISLRQEERRALQWLDGLIQNLSQEASCQLPQETVLVIDNDSTTKGDEFLEPKLSAATKGESPLSSHLWNVSTLAQFRKSVASVSLLRASIAALVLVAIFYGMFADRFGVLGSRPAFQQAVETSETRERANRRSGPESQSAPGKAATARPDPTAATPATALVPNSLTMERNFPLPSAYGIYAIANRELFELDALPGRAPDPRIFMSAVINKPSRRILPNGRISFLAFRRDLATNAPDRVSVRVIASVMRTMTFDTAGKASVTKAGDLWAIRNVAYNYRVAPLTEQPEMLVMQSDNSDLVLPAGRYGIVLKDSVYDFTVTGAISDAAQCLERTMASNGTFYSECRKP